MSLLDIIVQCGFFFGLPLTTATHDATGRLRFTQLGILPNGVMGHGWEEVFSLVSGPSINCGSVPKSGRCVDS